MSQGPTQIVTIELSGSRARYGRGDRSIKRTMTVQQRSDMVRERVRDAVTLIGMGDPSYGEKQFARRAVAAAEREHLRSWKVDSPTHRPEDIAHMSLQNLLMTGNNRTGRNHHWVLDLWEAVLSEIYHGTPKRRRSSVTDPAVDQVEASPLGVQVFADPPKPTRSLAMRLLDAYTSRDDEAVMQLALELEETETS